MIAFVSFLFLAAVAARPQDRIADYFNAEANCLPKFPSVTKEFLQELKQSRKLPDDPTDDFKCFMACVGKEMQVLSHNGELHFDNLKNLTVSITGGDVDHDTAHKMVSKCMQVDENDNCEKAWQYSLCKIAELMPYKLAKRFCPTCTD